MKNESIDKLYRELSAKPDGEGTGAKETGADDTPQEEETDPKSEKLSYRYATAGLAILVVVLLAFFLGMRLIERRAEKLLVTEPAVQTTVTERGLTAEERININTASREELMALQGIGEKKAQAVIDHRNEYGPFTDISEIMDVDGIGEGIFENIKDDICV